MIVAVIKQNCPINLYQSFLFQAKFPLSHFTFLTENIVNVNCIDCTTVLCIKRPPCLISTAVILNRHFIVIIFFNFDL